MVADNWLYFILDLVMATDPRRFATAAGCGQPWQLQQGGRHSRLVTTMVSQRIAVLEQELGQSCSVAIVGATRPGLRAVFCLPRPRP